MGRRNPFYFPRFSQRPLNYCKSCTYTWYPRGKDLSYQCPRCGSTLTGNTQLLSCLILVAAIVVSPIVLCLGLGLRSNSSDDSLSIQSRNDRPLAEKWPKRESEVPDQPSIDNGKDFPGSHTPNGPKKETVPTTTAKDPKILVEEPMESTKQPKPPKESDEAEEKARKPKEGVEDKARKAKAEADREAERLRLQEQDAATLLQLAKSLIETDKDRAMRSLQNIVRQYPKTKAAAEAKKLLAIL